ncbi:hypothetical protein FJZ53_03585 [Candidatus Woesearchaeota archaeon]|nr:hypothetical protein [Candidatus Woesearchaeota archaeon]
MGIEEKLAGMDSEHLQRYKKKEQVKAIIGTTASVIPVTGAAGFYGGIGIGYLLATNMPAGGPPETDFAMGMMILSMSAITMALASWGAGAAYTAKKWYNTYKAGKKLEEITGKE